MGTITKERGPYRVSKMVFLKKGFNIHLQRGILPRLFKGTVILFKRPF